MAFVNPQRSKLYIKTDFEQTSDISGTIGLAGEATGFVTINFPEKIALTIVSNMLGEQMKNITPVVKDAVGEIANMIAGGAKGELIEKGYSFKISLPVVSIGKNHYTNYAKENPCIVIPFIIPEGEFTVDVVLSRTVNIA